MRTLFLSALLAMAPAVADDTKHDMAVTNLFKGQDALRQEHWSDAETYFGLAIQYEPLLEMAHYGLGQAYMGEHRYDEAIQAYKQCRTVFVTNATAALAEDAQAERRIDDQIRALRDYRENLTTGRTRPQNGQMTLNVIDNQIAQLETVRKRESTGAAQVAPFISTALGSAYFRAGNTELAEAEWRNALKVDPKIGEVHNNLAVVCLLSGRAAEAADHVRAAEKAGIRVNPQLKQDIADRLK